MHRQVHRERRGLPKARIDDEVLDRALDVQGELDEGVSTACPFPT